MPAPSALRQLPPEQPELPDSADIIVDGEGGLGNIIDNSSNVVSIEYPDGSVKINLSPSASSNPEAASKHDENLALHIGPMELATVSDHLLRLIDQDIQDQQQRLTDIAKGLELLGLKYEEPKSEPNEEGMSVVRHPLLLESVLIFQANCRGEMLPASGPVKVRVDGGETQENDEWASALEDDFNHYLTVGAPEYYPDTDRMFFSAGFGGEAYKKVYHDPLKRRPVSMTVDRKDLILSDGAVALEACPRITHRLRMPPSQVKRMQIVGAWRDVTLTMAAPGQPTQVDTEINEIAGVQPTMTTEPNEVERQIYECYCELDLQGFEHKDKEKGKPSGLSVPYRVTIDKDSKEVLEIRRWWREDDDELCLRKEVFVDYVFVPGPGGLNLGLFHILCNATRALTAGWRIALDNGMLANFPGFLMARGSGRQQTTNIRIAPGQGAPVDVQDGMAINQSVMPLPYRDVTPGFMGVLKMIEEDSQRLAGTANQGIGEGKQNVPVGTTIALIEQATQVVGAVHKRMHQSQTKEFGMLKELFKEQPDAFWRGNPKPSMAKNADKLVEALNNSNIVPAADPNTASQTMRIQKAIAIKTLAAQSPQLYDMLAVDKRVLAMLNVEDADELFTKTPPQGPAPDPAKMADSQAKMLAAQAKMEDVKLKSQTSQLDAQTKMAGVHVQAMDAQSDAMNRAADRKSKERQAMMSLAKTEGLHPGSKQDMEDMVRHPLFPDMGGGSDGPEPAPMPGARKARDGNWYLPDQARPGKYLQVMPHG